jgi:predicted nucleotidyltransferase
MQQQSIDELKKKIVPVLKEAGVTRAALFGSVARGEATETSDVDILFDPPQRMGLFQYSGLALRLEDTLGKKVDLVTYNSLKPILRPYVEKDMVTIL